MYAIFHLKEILYDGAISCRQRTRYKLRFSVDNSLAMLMVVIHGLFAALAGSTKPTLRQEASYSSRYRALYRALTDVIIPQSDNFEMHAISTILSKRERTGTKSKTMSQYFHLSDIRTDWLIRNRILFITLLDFKIRESRHNSYNFMKCIQCKKNFWKS